MMRVRPLLLVRTLLVSTLLGASAAAAEPARRFTAPVTVQQPATFVQLALPASAYARSQQAGLADLLLVDARGDRVPFAFLPPPENVANKADTQQPATLYPLPRRAAAGAPLSSPVEVLVQGDRIQVRRLGRTAAGAAPADTPGWLIDLGERRRDAAPPQLLRLQWTGPAEFNAAFDIDTSDTLREWRPAGSGQLLALLSPTGALVQRDVVLPLQTHGSARFVRLVWRDPAGAPVLSGALAVVTHTTHTAQDSTTELQFAASPQATGQAESAKGALHFDLGGPLPLQALDLRLPPGTRVLPARVQGRNRDSEAWQDIGQHVFYRLQRDATLSASAPLQVQTSARYVRVLADPRAAAPEPTQTSLVVQARLATLVFAQQGQPPFALQTGASGVHSGALPIATLVPQLNEERARLGRAEMGAWTEVADVARAAQSDERKAAMRPWLLWAVLLAGVAGLGFMVWRLVKTRHEA